MEERGKIVRYIYTYIYFFMYAKLSSLRHYYIPRVTRVRPLILSITRGEPNELDTCWQPPRNDQTSTPNFWPEINVNLQPECSKTYEYEIYF